MVKTPVLLVVWVFTLYRHVSYGQIPMSMWRKMANITSTSDFLEEFVAPQERQGVVAQYNTMGQSQRESIANIVTGDAGCMPQEDTVSIPSDEDVNIVRWPTCTRVNRCSGCCGHEILQCAPTHVQMQPVQVLRARYPFPGAERLIVEGIEEVVVERHLACECRCGVQPQDCNAATQQYDAEACRCRCKDPDEWMTCAANQRWDTNTCSCICTNTFRCFSNEVFSNNTCRCENRQARTVTGSSNELQRSTPPSLTDPPVTTMNPCPHLRCLAGSQPQVMLGACRCIVVHRYTSSQSSLEQGRLFPVEATDYKRFPKPFPDDLFTRYTASPRDDVHRIFQRFPIGQHEESGDEDEKLEIKVQKKHPFRIQESKKVEPSISSPSPVKVEQEKNAENHQRSPSATHSDERHHVEIAATNIKPKRYTGAHHAEGGPLQLRQPMIQANYGHV